MSPLEILRFTISPAFSHKELMGHFEASLGLYCQNDEVSLDVHGRVRERVARYPTDPPQQAAPGGSAPHLAQRGISLRCA